MNDVEAMEGERRGWKQRGKDCIKKKDLIEYIKKEMNP